MSTQRFIYPQIFRSEQVASLSPMGRLLFIGCFTTADDEGRRKATPASIRADIFPLDDIPLAEVEKLRDEVAASGLIRVYFGPESGPILDIPNWARFQNPKYVKKSIFPAYSATLGQSGPEAGRKPGENSPEPGHGLGRVGMGRDGLGRTPLPPKGGLSDAPKTDTAKAPPKQRKRKASGNTDIKAFLDWWFEAFKNKTGSPYAITGKDGSISKRLLGTYSLAALEEYAGRFFSNPDEFAQKAGLTLGVFAAQLNKIISVGTHDPYFDGYSLPAKQIEQIIASESSPEVKAADEAERVRAAEAEERRRTRDAERAVRP